MENNETKTEEVQKGFLAKTEELVKRNEEAVKQMSDLVKRNEEATQRQMLGGKTDAGLTPEKPKEETPQEYARRMMGR